MLGGPSADSSPARGQGEAMEEAQIEPTSLPRRVWLPARTRDLLIGLVLAVVLPWLSAWLVSETATFERVPGLAFLAATILATLVGRLTASVIATLVSAALIASLGVPPLDGIGTSWPQD